MPSYEPKFGERGRQSFAPDVYFARVFIRRDPSSRATCESLADLKLPETTIVLAKSFVAGAFTPPAGPPVSPIIVPYSSLPGFCRVTGIIKPSSDSSIQFEVWMPSADWNGKLQNPGNGGFAGTIPYPSMAVALARGYAVASTDTGHVGIDASWALGHPEKVIDFGYRAIHDTTIRAKEILRLFYGNGPHRSYFSSCSNGGRQALMEAQRYPEDYDGILAGAPANFWTHLFSGFAWDAQVLNKPGNYIPASKLSAIEAAARAVCDGRDGVVDGVIDEPVKCHFDPSTLLCKGPASDGCLTAPQISTLKRSMPDLEPQRANKYFPVFLRVVRMGRAAGAFGFSGRTVARVHNPGLGSNSSPTWSSRTHHGTSKPSESTKM